MSSRRPYSIDPDVRAAQQEERDNKALIRRTIAEDDIRTVMSTEQGRRVVFKLLDMAGVQRISFVAGDALHTAFNEGQRNLGLWLTAQLTPDEYAVMMKENANG
jgi:hypothetical protein